MNRRSFVQKSLAAGTLAAVGTQVLKSEDLLKPSGQFRLKYAPHFGMFENHAGKDLVDQVRFMADQGFSAMEDNDMWKREVADQEKVARELDRLGMTMGVFVAYADFKNPTFTAGKTEDKEMVLGRIRDSIEVAKRVNARWMTVVPGTFDPGLEWGYQTSNVIDLLKACVEICEPAGVTMVLEPLNPWTNHPGLFLTKIPQAYQICRAVNSPSCKILDDLYHQQVTEGNLIPNLDRAWDEIAYFQLGDNPGRKEPTTGEINFKNIFRHLHAKGYTGILGMEHGKSLPGLEGEKALLAAYRACDSF
ncbi:MAG: TIM barrel protein [Opitutaceae bacterium]